MNQPFRWFKVTMLRFILPKGILDLLCFSIQAS